MAANIKNMTEGRPLPLIVSFALPLMLGNIFQQLYTVVDTMVVGKGLGVDALAALGATDWLYWMVLGMIQGVTQGFSILMAREFGAGKHENLRRVVGSSVTLAALCAAGFLVVSQLAAQPILMLLNTPDEVIGQALLYLRVMFFGIPIVMAYNLLACILRSLGDSRTPLSAMIVAAGTNIVLDLLFVLVFRWGIGGAAAATLIAQFCSAVFCFLRLRKIDILALKADHFRPRDGLAVRLLSLGWPMALQNIMIAVGGMIITSVVNGYSVAFIAGFTATNKLYGVLEVAATSYGYSMVTYTGQNLGAGRTDRIRKGVRSALLIALVTSLIIALLMIFGGKTVLSWFISGTPEEFEQTLVIAYYYLAIMSLCLPILYTLHITRSAIQGMGNTILPLVSGIAEFLMRALTAIFLPMVIGENGIFYAEIMAWTGATVILVISYFAVIRRMERLLKR